jgi:hypothetical protein
MEISVGHHKSVAGTKVNKIADSPTLFPRPEVALLALSPS